MARNNNQTNNHSEPRLTRRAFATTLATLLFAALFALTACSGAGAGTGSDASDSQTASDSSAASSSVITVEAPDYTAVPEPTSSEPMKLAIIHTNDTHGYDQASDSSLGMAAVAQLKADYEAEGYDVLLLDAGDFLQGNLLVDDSDGAVAPDFMNECGYDAAALGNHEFDYGADVLEQRIAACDFPILCANITVDATGESFAEPNIVFTLSDGTKLGVFALDTPETLTKSDPVNTAGLTFAQGEDLYACAQAQIDELRAEGCDLVICLGHLGEEDASAPNRASDVVAAIEGLDLFIDGHDHHVENTTITDKSGKDVLVVETGCYLANIGVVLYEDGSFEETLVAVGDYDGADEKVEKIIDAIAADIEARLSEVIGSLDFLLDGNRAPGVRDRETNLGDLVPDAFRWEAKQATGSEPDASIVNGGSIRSSVEPGDITLADLHNVYPYSDLLCTMEVTGAQLLEALEAACQGLPDQMGAFPQVSGVTYTVDPSVPYEKGEQYPYSTYHKPAKPGSRVTITDVNGKGFDLEATYTIVVSDFIAYGGDTYCCFEEAAMKSMQSIGYTPSEAIRYYVTEICDGGSVPDEYAAPQGRITVVGQE